MYHVTAKYKSWKWISRVLRLDVSRTILAHAKSYRECVVQNEKSHKAAHESTSCCLPRSRRAATAVRRNKNWRSDGNDNATRLCKMLPAYARFFAAVLRNEDIAPGCNQQASQLLIWVKIACLWTTFLLCQLNSIQLFVDPQWMQVSELNFLHITKSII